MTAYDLAQKEVGTVEWAKGDNPKVLAYFKDSGNAWVNDDETAWCAAFVGAMLERSGVKGTGKLNARSYLDWGMPVERKDARPGDVVIFKRGTGWQGHVGFFVKDRGALIDVLGGNQSDAVNIKPQQSASLLGIRRPAGQPLASKPVAVSDKPVSGVKPAPREPIAPPVTPPPATGPLAAIIRALGALFRKGT
jgi:uncharacterized protein (TIGR02594 family)